MRRQRDLGRIGRRAEGLANLAAEFLLAFFHGALAQFAAAELHLHEEGLSVCPRAPVGPVVDLGIVFEIVIGLAEARLALGFTGLAGSGISDKSAPDAGVITRPLQDRGNGLDSLGQRDLQFPPAAAVLVGADRGLIHARDEGRPAGRAHRRGDVGAGETRAFLRQLIDAGGRDRRFSVAGETRRHVVDDEPEHVRTLGGVQCR